MSRASTAQNAQNQNSNFFRQVMSSGRTMFRAVLSAGFVSLFRNSCRQKKMDLCLCTNSLYKTGQSMGLDLADGEIGVPMIILDQYDIPLGDEIGDEITISGKRNRLSQKS